MPGKCAGSIAMRDDMLAPLDLKASGADFTYALRLDADRPLVLQGNAGYSRKSERGQASYYYSQPFFKASGRISIDDKPVDVTGLAWMDREWSSQPLARPDRLGLVLAASERGRKTDAVPAAPEGRPQRPPGNWITPDARSVEISPQPTTASRRPTYDRRRRPQGADRMARRHSARGLAIETTALNAGSWMGTSFPYWEGPISFTGSHAGLGYLEMTGY